jgi:hypothetical protein
MHVQLTWRGGHTRKGWPNRPITETVALSENVEPPMHRTLLHFKSLDYDMKANPDGLWHCILALALF